MPLESLAIAPVDLFVHDNIQHAFKIFDRQEIDIFALGCAASTPGLADAGNAYPFAKPGGGFEGCQSACSFDLGGSQLQRMSDQAIQRAQASMRSR